MSILVTLLAFLLCCFLFSVIMNRVGLKNLVLSRRFQKPAVFCGETSEMVETIINDHLAVIPWLRVESRISPYLHFGTLDNLEVRGEMYHRSLFTVMPYRKIIRHHRVTFLRRGIYNVGSAALTAGDITGMFRSTREQLLNMSVTVFPRILPPEEMPHPLQELSGNWSRERQLLKDPFLVRGIREYQLGDPIRDIHWPASARMQTLQVRIHDDEAHMHVMVLINGQLRDDQWDDLMDYEQERIEYLISVAATLCLQAMRQGMRAGFSGNIAFTDGDDRECAYVSPDMADGNEEYLLSRFAALKIHRVLSFPSFLADVKIPENTSLVILSAYSSEAILEKVSALRTHGYPTSLQVIGGGKRA
ncbi:MAG: DUF58 domain-containing protein [Clostridia bacterium]|nr:DUF58 domain-containing protein [Clostridia bacterium]